MVMHCIALSCTILHHLAPSCAILHQITPCCTMLHHVATGCTIVHRVAPCCTMLQHVAPSCTILHHVAPCCTMLHHLAPSCSILHYLALSCTNLHYLALSCTILQCCPVVFIWYTCSKQMSPVIAFDIAFSHLVSPMWTLGDLYEGQNMFGFYGDYFFAVFLMKICSPLQFWKRPLPSFPALLIKII